MQHTLASLPTPALPPLAGKIAYSPDKFDIVCLGSGFMQEIENILREVQAAQKPDQKHFIKPQTLGDLFRHYAQGLPVIGSVEKTTGNVAGLMLLTPSQNTDYNPVLAKLPTIAREADTAIIGSVATTRGYTGQMKPLLAAAEAHAAALGLMGVWAKVSIENTRSGDRFKEAGWQRKLVGVDPDQGYKVGFWRKNLVGIAPMQLPVFTEANSTAQNSNIHPFIAPDLR